MRTIRKPVRFTEVEVTYYDREEKLEKTEVFECNEVNPTFGLPSGAVLLEEKVLSERVVTLEMSPEIFMKHAVVYADTDSVK